MPPALLLLQTLRPSALRQLMPIMGHLPAALRRTAPAPAPGRRACLLPAACRAGGAA